MARDYARPKHPSGGRGNPARRPARSGRPAGMPGWAGVAIGLTVGLAVAVAVGAYYSISRPENRIAIGHGAPPAPSPDETKATGGKTIKLPPKQPSRFAFYEMLPSYEVVIPRETSKPAPPGQAPAPSPAPAAAPDVQQALAEPGQYLIQVGAFRSRDEADKHRASLALLGVESRIEQVTIDQKDTWYRVRIGPEPSLAKAQAILDHLDQNHIQAMLIKVKG